MKITFLTPHLKVSGGVKIIVGYAHNLALLGHKVKIVLVHKKFIGRAASNLFGRRPRWLANLKLDICRIPAWQEKFLPASDVVVASAWDQADFISRCSPKIGLKVHLIQHDERLYHGQRSAVEKVYQKPLVKIAVSTWLKEIIENEFRKNTYLLINPVAREQFYPYPRQSGSREVKILLLHHNYKWKGTAEGVAIVQELKQKYKNVKLMLFGARQKDIEYDCDEYYYDLPQDRLAWLYSRADIFLCPSWDEGFGLPSVEAMACGCALVTYDNGGSRDFAFDGQTAMVAKRRDRQDLKNKLELLIKDQKLRHKIAQNGFEFVKNMPSWSQQVKKMEEIFKKELKIYANY